MNAAHDRSHPKSSGGSTALRSLKSWLDEAFRVPGTNLRFGWDPLIGLVPWVGDLLTALMSGAIVLQAHQMRLPRVVQLRMLGNVAIDLLAGAIPFVGDAADFFWKSNKKNFALLEQHAYEVRPAIGRRLAVRLGDPAGDSRRCPRAARRDVLDWLGVVQPVKAAL